MLRIIKETKPRWVIGENVPGLLSIEKGMVFERVCIDMESEGYEVWPLSIPACGVDAKHKRERIFIVANTDKKRIQRNRTNRKQVAQSQVEKRMLRCSSTTCRECEDQIETPEAMANGSNPRIKDMQEREKCSSVWPIEPGVGRVADGIPDRSHRIKGLGNAVVPKVAETLGRAIMDFENLKKESE